MTWICMNTSSYKIFCRMCCRARSHGLVTFCKCNLTFVEGGFCNWKKVLQHFTDHEKSETHQETLINLAAKSSIIDIGAAQHAT